MWASTANADKIYSLQGAIKNAEGSQNEFSLISNDALTVNPTGVSASHNVVSISYNNIKGHFNDIPLAQKMKIIWKFDAATNFTELENIMAKVKNNLLAHGTRYYFIKTWCPGFGWVQGWFYLGTPTNFDTEGVLGKATGLNAGQPASPKFEMHWIEAGDSTTDIHNNMIS